MDKLVGIHGHFLNRHLGRIIALTDDVLNRFAGEIIDGSGRRHLNRNGGGADCIGNRQWGGCEGPVDHEPIDQIRPGIALGVNLAGSDVARVGGPVNFDQLAHVSRFLVADGRAVIIHRVLLAPERSGHPARLLEGARGIVERGQGAAVNLLIVGFASHHLVGRNVEGDRAGTQPQRIEVRVSVVHRRLEARRQGLEFTEFRHRGAVDLLHAGVDGIFRRQQGIAHCPIEQRALGRATHRIVQRPAGCVAREMRPPTSGVVLVVLAVNQLANLLRGAG